MGMGRFRTDEGRVHYAAAYRAALDEMPEPSTAEDITTTFGTVRAYHWVAAGDDRAPILLL